MRFVIWATAVVTVMLCSSWGFFAHMEINRKAIYTLPSGMLRFYKNNVSYLSDHAVDADKRRYADTAEAPRHYLDVELYEKNIDSIPRKWNDAITRYGQSTLHKQGILPWQIEKSYYKLVDAFKERDSMKILTYSAYLGHYVADAHVPLHTSSNHDGQLTNQVGIHAFWESRLPELFAGNYNFMVGRAKYIENPLTEAWRVIAHSHSLLACVLSSEAKVSASFPAHKKYGFSKRNNKLLKQYSKAYAKAYELEMNHMVELQMRASMLSIGSFWYSAWVDAGQPTLNNF